MHVTVESCWSPPRLLPLALFILTPLVPVGGPPATFLLIPPVVALRGLGRELFVVLASRFLLAAPKTTEDEALGN